MPDISHLVRADLIIDATGDIATSDGSDLSEQRVLRRLLTNSGKYIWQPTYGAGLARFLGRPMAAQRIAAVIRSQMFKEASVARSPAPQITVSAQKDGTTIASIKYADAETGATTTFSFPVA